MNEENQTNQPVDQDNESSKNLNKPSSKPKHLEVKQLKKLESANNKFGDRFEGGDKITVIPPWGGQAVVEITDFYQDHSGNAWARFTASEAPPGWTWLGGCLRASRLIKA
ncbi:MAG: hypothetical protein WA919_26460 [Coleofasciculaceae cyanobacterium]